MAKSIEKVWTDILDPVNHNTKQKVDYAVKFHARMMKTRNPKYIKHIEQNPHLVPNANQQGLSGKQASIPAKKTPEQRRAAETKSSQPYGAARPTALPTGGGSGGGGNREPPHGTAIIYTPAQLQKFANERGTTVVEPLSPEEAAKEKRKQLIASKFKKIQSGQKYEVPTTEFSKTTMRDVRDLVGSHLGMHYDLGEEKEPRNEREANEKMKPMQSNETQRLLHLANIAATAKYRAPKKQGMTKMDNRSPSDDRREQRAYSPEAIAQRDWGPKNGRQKQGVAEGIEDKVAKHNAAVAKMIKRSYTDLNHNHPDLLKKAPKGYSFSVSHKLVKQGLAEGSNDTVYPNAKVIKSKNGKSIGEIYKHTHGWGAFHYKADNGADSMRSKEEALEHLKNMHNEYRQQRLAEEAEQIDEGDAADLFGKIPPRHLQKIRDMDKGSMTGGKNKMETRLKYLKALHAHQRKYGIDTLKTKEQIEKINRTLVQIGEEVEQDETMEKVEMAQTQLHFIAYAADEILEYIEKDGEIEEWYQNKLSKVHSDMESLFSYVEGEKRRTGMVQEGSPHDSLSGMSPTVYYHDKNHKSGYTNTKLEEALERIREAQTPDVNTDPTYKDETTPPFTPDGERPPRTPRQIKRRTARLAREALRRRYPVGESRVVQKTVLSKDEDNRETPETPKQKNNYAKYVRT